LPLRTSWVDFAWGLNDNNVTLVYANLDPRAKYRVRVNYPDIHYKSKIRFVANDTIEEHPFIARANPIAPVAFDISQSATASGKLYLSWNREPGLGGNGSGCSISEVWLEKKTSGLTR
jgi:hypothetical protein